MRPCFVLVTAIIAISLAGCRKHDALTPRAPGSITSTTSMTKKSAPLMMAAARFPKAMVTLTFDDGWDGQVLAADMLAAHGMRGTFYIVPTYLGDDEHMTADDVVALARIGNEIGSHSMTHPRFSEVDDDVLLWEMSESQRTLEKLVGAPIVSFASPFGNYDERVVEKSKQLYTSHRGAAGHGSGNCRVFSPRSSPFLVEGCLVQEGLTGIRDRPNVEKLLTQTVRERGWLILAFHQITETPTHKNDETPEDFNEVLDLIAASPVSVVTMADAVKMLPRDATR